MRLPAELDTLGIEWGAYTVVALVLLLTAAIAGRRWKLEARSWNCRYTSVMPIECAAAPFHTCGSCRRAWLTSDEFVLDPAVRLVGLQAVNTNPDLNLLVFEHRCGSSISILTPRLRHLLPEPESGDPKPRLLDTDQCRGHCRRLEDLEECDAPCSNARDRKLILLVRHMKNSPGLRQPSTS